MVPVDSESPSGYMGGYYRNSSFPRSYRNLTEEHVAEDLLFFFRSIFPLTLTRCINVAVVINPSPQLIPIFEENSLTCKKV